MRKAPNTHATQSPLYVCTYAGMSQLQPHTPSSPFLMLMRAEGDMSCIRRNAHGSLINSLRPSCSYCHCTAAQRNNNNKNSIHSSVNINSNSNVRTNEKDLLYVVTGNIKFASLIVPHTYILILLYNTLRNNRKR
jgi:hypothetical protein